MKKNDIFTFVHIGKCGGSTVRTILKKNKYKFNTIHTKQFKNYNGDNVKINEVKFSKDYKYLITIRNPIERFISAFKWRYNRNFIAKDQRRKNEIKIFNKYKTLENLINNLKENKNLINGNFGSDNHIGHLKEDINYYLGSILDNCNKNDIIGVICTETLDKDIQNILNIKFKKKTIKCKDTKKIDFNGIDKISENARKILKDYLKKDYECIDKLYKMKLISKEQYEILSK